MKKVFAMLLCLVMVLSLAAVGGTAMAKGPVKIGVLVSDVSGEEALGFRAYYEDYIAKNYDVSFTYTEQLADAAAEKSAIEKFAAQGYDAILSLAASDRVTQLETCKEYGLYYAVVSGMLDDAQYEQFKGEEYFVGQIGPSMDTEFEAGFAMGQYFAEQGAKTVGIYGAFIPNPMHVYRTAGVLAGLGCTYGGTLVKGGSFMLRMSENEYIKKMTDKMLDAYASMGKLFAKNGNFMFPEAKSFTGPEQIPWAARQIMAIALKRIVNRKFDNFAKGWGCTRPLDDKVYSE